MQVLLRMAYRNVTLNWRHSLASILSVAAAFFSLNVFQGYVSDLSSLYEVSYRQRFMLGDLMITHKDSDLSAANAEPWNFSLSPDAQKAISEFAKKYPEQIIATNRFLRAQGMITNGQVSTIFLAQGYDLKEGALFRGEEWGWNATYGIPIDRATKISEDLSGVAQIANGLAKMMNCLPVEAMNYRQRNGQYIEQERPFECKNSSLQLTATTDSGQVSAIDLEVVGFMDAGFNEVDKKLVWMNLSDLQTLLNTKRVTMAQYLIKSKKYTKQIIENFNLQVVSQFPELRIERWQDNAKTGELYVRTMELLAVFRNFVSLIIIVISCLSVLNTMTKSLNERVKEIGTLLSLGYRKSHIRSIFISESIFLSLFGIAIGAVTGFILTSIVNSAGILYKAGLLSESVALRIELNLPLLFTSALALLALSGLATAWACQRALKKKIVECLHHVS